jgi:hypothetical protein
MKLFPTRHIDKQKTQGSTVKNELIIYLLFSNEFVASHKLSIKNNLETKWNYSTFFFFYFWSVVGFRLQLHDKWLQTGSFFTLVYFTYLLVRKAPKVHINKFSFVWREIRVLLKTSLCELNKQCEESNEHHLNDW